MISTCETSVGWQVDTGDVIGRPLLLQQDTFGISKILSDYTVETTFQRVDDSSTKVEISHYYSTTTLKAKLLNLIAKGRIARETQATLKAAKAAIEAAHCTG